MAEMDAQIGLTADASGVEAGVGRAKKSLASLGASATKMGQDVAGAGDKAGKALNGIGGGGDKAAKEVARATKNIEGQLQRAIAAFEAGEKGSRQFYESLARQRGADVNALRPLLDQLDAYKGRAAGAAGSTASLSKSFSGLQSVLVGLGVYGVSKQFIAAADSVTTLNNQLALATGSAGAARNAYEALFDIAQRSRVGFVELGQTFASISRAAGELGIGQQRMLAVTEAIGNAMTISGGSAQGMQAALVQLSQGMASGVLRGEELNSVMEQAPRLAKALADGLGVPIGRLREMGAAGEITADKVVKALESQASVLKNEVAGATLTVSQAMTQLGNASLKAVGELDKATGASSAVASAISEIGGAIGSVGQFAKENEAVIKSVLGSMAGVGVAAGILKTAGAIAGAGGMVAAITAVRTAFLALSAVMAANPVGLALLGIGAATGAAIAMNGAPKGAERLAREIEVTSERIARAEAQLAAAGGSRGGKDTMTARLEARIEAMRKYRNELQAQAGQTDGSIDVGAFPSRGSHAQYEKERTQALAKAEADLVDVRMRAAGVNKSYLDDLGKLSRALEAGAIGHDEYVKQVEALATSTWKSSAAGKEAEKGLKSGASEAKKAAAEYQNLITSINERISAQTQELSQSGKLTESQKIAIKLQEEMASGKVKLTAAQQAEIDGRLQVLRGLEQEVKQRQLALQAFAEYLSTQEELNADYVAQSKAREAGRQAVSDYSRGIDEANDALKYELSLMGLGEQARNVAIEQYRIELDLKKQIAAVNKNEGFTQADRDEEVARLTAAAAIAKANAASKVFLDDWKRSVQQYDDIFRQGFADMLNNGKDGWKSFTRSLVTTFKTTVADQIYKMFAQPFVVNIVGNLLGVTGGGAGGAAMQMASGGGSGVLGMGSNIASIFGAGGIGGSLMAGAGWLTGATTLGGSLTAGASLLGTGTLAGGAAGLGMIAGAIAPIALAAAALGNVFGLFRKTEKRGYGLMGTLGEEDGVHSLDLMRKGGSLFGGPKWFVRDTGVSEMDKALQDTYKQQRDALMKMGEALGLATDHVKDFTVQLGSDELGDKKVRGIRLDGLSDEEAQKKIAEALATANNEIAQQIIGTWERTVREVERIDISRPTDVGDTTDYGVPNVIRESIVDERYIPSEFARDGEQAIDTLTRLATSLTGVNTAFENLGVTLYEASLAGGDMASQLVDLFGGLEQFSQSTGVYMQNFYSAEEQRDAVRRQLERAFESLNLNLPDIDASDARAQFRAIAEAQDLTTESGRRTWAALMGLAGAFSSVTEEAESAADAAARLAEEQARLAEEQARLRDEAIDKAYRNLQAATDRQLKSIDKQREALSQQRDSYAESLSLITGIFDIVRSNARELYGEVADTAGMQAAQGMLFIENALTAARATGALPESDALSQAIQAARSGISDGAYVSQFERDRDTLVLAGQLSALEAISGKQKTFEEQQIERLDGQLKGLDKQSKLLQEQLDYWREQIDISRGAYDATMSVEQAVRDIEALIKPKDPAPKPQAPGGSGGSAGGPSFGGGRGAATPEDTARYRRMVYGGTAGVGYSTIRDEALIARLDKLAPVYHAFDGTGDLVGLAEAFKAAGGTIADLSILSGNWESDWRKAFAGVGIPAFAGGGMHAGGLRVVGERGWELEATGPARIWNQQQLGRALGGGNAELIAEMRALREEVAQLKSINAATAVNTSGLPQMVDQFDNVTEGGNGMRRGEVVA